MLIDFLKQQTTNNNSQTLTKVGFEPLNLTQTGGDWATILDAYKLAKKDTFEDISATKINEEILKKRCKKASQNTNSSKEKLLAAKWCSKKQTINETFKKVGRKVLNSNSSDEDWRKFISENDNKQSDIDELKKFCKDIGNTFNTDDGFSDNLELARSCSIEE